MIFSLLLCYLCRSKKRICIGDIRRYQAISGDVGLMSGRIGVYVTEMVHLNLRLDAFRLLCSTLQIPCGRGQIYVAVYFTLSVLGHDSAFLGIDFTHFAVSGLPV